jgi:hypothetical protein
MSSAPPAQDVSTAKLPHVSTAGPSGLSPVHLADCLKADGSLAQALADFATLFIDGQMPVEARSLFLDAIPEEEKPVGIPPIAVCETLRRLIPKCLIQVHQKEAVTLLVPQQMGVGVTQGVLGLNMPLGSCLLASAATTCSYLSTSLTPLIHWTRSKCSLRSRD